MLRILADRRDGRPHTQADLEALAQGAADGQIPDYQLSAWLMAAVLNPLSAEETAWLTMAMARSGDVLNLAGLPTPWVDKHSTGGVGDKTSLVLLPLLAALGMTVVKMSGRGLGITGGTVDKLESVPGFRMDLSPAELLEQARRIGLAITGPTASLAPADKVLYALRDATATVASVPLIVSSILSKKIAGGAKTVILDVKCGSGAFMPNLDAAEELGRALKRTAELCGLKLSLAITDMNQPLGRAVGNALEVREAIEVLHGSDQGRFGRLCAEMGGRALLAVGRVPSLDEGIAQAREALQRGHALAKARAWFAAQGADPAVMDSAEGLPIASIVEDVEYAGPAGFVSRVDARRVGQAAMDLGAGRQSKTDSIDPAVGVEVLAEVGKHLASGKAVFRIHANDRARSETARESLVRAIGVSAEPVPEPALVLSSM